MIPIYTIKLGHLEKKYVNDCLNTGWISGAGTYVEEFEKEFAKYLGVRYALTTTSGTTALHLMLVAAGIGPGDEVIIPDYTFVSTALAVSYTGATPVFVDVDRKTWNIDVNQIESAITKKTKAIIPVDIYGLPVDMLQIQKISKKHEAPRPDGRDIFSPLRRERNPSEAPNEAKRSGAKGDKLLILEDAAEALGAEIYGKKVGAEADSAIFSFYGNKTITTGEGGMLVTNNKTLYEKAKSLKEYGRDKKNRYISNMVGFNYRLTNLQAAIGLGQLKRIETILKRKAEILSLYKQYLKTNPGVIFQEIPKGFIPSAWLISIVIDQKLYGRSKDSLSQKLHKAGIDTRDFFPPLHRQPIYHVILSASEGSSEAASDAAKRNNNFPISDYLYTNGLSLPSYPTLKNSDIKYICATIKKFSSGNS